MKLLLNLLACGMMLFQASLSHAQDAAVEENFVYGLHPVSYSELTLIGRGVQNRKTNDVISLACAGERVSETSTERNCNIIRYVYISAKTQEAFLYGDRIYVTIDKRNVSQKEIQEALKIESIYYRDFKALLPDGIRQIAIILPSSGSAIVLTALGLVPELVVGGIFIGGLVLMFMSYSDHNKLFNQSSISTAMFDHGRWNWSVQPKKKSAREFKRLLRFSDASILQNNEVRLQDQISLP